MLLWAQAVGTDPDALPLLSLRRWFESVTLSSPQMSPVQRLWLVWLAALLGLLVLSVVAQGPRRALRELIGIRGHLMLWRAGVGRVMRSGRALAILLGCFVLSWTSSQFFDFWDRQRINDLYLLGERGPLTAQAIEQGVLAALTPLRDLASLGDIMPLLFLGGIAVFRLSARHWGELVDPYAEEARWAIREAIRTAALDGTQQRSSRVNDESDWVHATESSKAILPAWTTPCWGAAWLYLMYRAASLLATRDGFPLGGCFVIEALVVPALMAMSDGLLLGWLVVELRQAGLRDDPLEANLRGVLAIWPAAVAACVLCLPWRYLATGLVLFLPYAPGRTGGQVIVPLLRSWGPVWLQAGALLVAGATGAAAWSGGRPLGMLRQYGRMLRTGGARLVMLLAVGGGLIGLGAALAYWAVLCLPRQSWVLNAADGYGHYGSICVGLLMLGCLVELGAEALPRATIPAVGAAVESASESARAVS